MADHVLRRSVTSRVAMAAWLLMACAASFGAAAASPDFAAVVQRNGAAVVNVSNNSSVKLTLDAPPTAGADAGADDADDAGGVTALLRGFDGPDGKLKSREFP